MHEAGSLEGLKIKNQVKHKNLLKLLHQKKKSTNPEDVRRVKMAPYSNTVTQAEINVATQKLMILSQKD